MAEYFCLEIYNAILSFVCDLNQYYNCALVCKTFRFLLLKLRDGLLKQWMITKHVRIPSMRTVVMASYVNGVKHGYKRTFYGGKLYSTIPYVLGKRDGVAFLSYGERKIFYKKDIILKESFMDKEMRVQAEYLNGRSNEEFICFVNDFNPRHVEYSKWIRHECVGDLKTKICKHTIYICGRKYKQIWKYGNLKRTKYYKGKHVYVHCRMFKRKKTRCIKLTKRKYD